MDRLMDKWMDNQMNRLMDELVDFELMYKWTSRKLDN